MEGDAGQPVRVPEPLHRLGPVGDLLNLVECENESAIRPPCGEPGLLPLGLMTALSGYSLEQARADRTFWGRLVESAAGAHLRNTLEVSMRLAYWRDDPYEVDFVLSQGPRVLGIEVKSGPRVSAVPGLAAFRKRFPRARAWLVGGRAGVSPNEFLAQPASHWLEEAWRD